MSSRSQPEVAVIRKILVSLLIGAAPIRVVVAQSVQVTTAAADVPVKKVMLFSSGVGYFEHAGAVHGNSATRAALQDESDQRHPQVVVLQDQDGGRVGAITYPSQDPIAKTLRSFQIDITKNPSLADLLNQLRGAKVTIQSQAEQLTGTILGVEVRRKPTDKGEVVEVPVLNLLAGASIRAVELQTINNLTLDDPQLQDELTKALSALVAGARSGQEAGDDQLQRRRRSAGSHRIRRRDAGLEDELPAVARRQGQVGKLQGWAIVENQTESDWNDVSLSLVSGRPMSFTMDLYQPLYATRPNVVPEMFAGLRPQVYDGGIADARERVAMECPTASAPAAAANRLRAGREAACVSAERGGHDGEGRRRRGQPLTGHDGVQRTGVDRIDGVDRGARRAVSVHGWQRDAAATEIGDDPDHHRQRRDRTRVDLQRVGAAQQSAEWCAAQEHHREAPVAGPVDGARSWGIRWRRSHRQRAARAGAVAQLRDRSRHDGGQQAVVAEQCHRHGDDLQGRADPEPATGQQRRVCGRQQIGKGEDADHRTPIAAGVEAVRHAEAARNDAHRVSVQGRCHAGQGHDAHGEGRADPVRVDRSCCRPISGN